MLDPMIAFAELGELASDVRRVFEELERRHPAGCRTTAGECAPDLDVFELPNAYQIHVDLPGVSRDSVRVFIKAGTIVVAGEKLPPDPVTGSATTYHRVERSFGRFARAARLPGAIDAAGSRASLRGGELIVLVPRIPDRRGKEIEIVIE